ncbi:autotransporter outer membrane beta-barrel domain-containing protein [Tardiphaga alba]|uniref:Autotransporter outer membrane beta-barrel domain-containing protein n=1 Tax=Tardiphaga alba TaxID=340268 RepID=A0ABX8A9Q1_9BRAD|nr:autotransporter domain-containing protein [Tardiphaga alba]QUS40471.1 autotransporter outer membrane beta-barrel domain-containing protein [Tardiphaga alba]
MVESTTLQIGAGATGTVNLDGGTISAERVTTNAGLSTINLNGGTLQAAASSTTFMQGLNVANVRDGGAVIDTSGFDVTIAQSLLHSTIGGDAAIDGGLTKHGAGTLTLTGTNTYTGGTTFQQGTLNVGSADALGTAGTLSFTGGTLRYSAANQIDYSSRFSSAANQAYSIDTNGQNVSFASGLASAGGNLTKLGAGTLTLSGGNSYTGTTTIDGGTLTGGAANAFSAASATTVNTGGTLDLGGVAQTIFAVALAGGTLTNGQLTGFVTSTGGTINSISGGATLTTTSGITTITGINTFVGPTTVNGGTLVVNGSLTDPAIIAGGTLTGIGSVGDTTVNAGGTFAPGSGLAGTSMTVNGALTLQAGATYLVQVSPATASFATVTGPANIGGATVSANFASGSNIKKQYTILTAGAVQGTFAALANTNLPANFSNALSYDATNAYLNLALDFGISGGTLNTNQRNVGNALTNYFNTTGGIPAAFGSLTAAGLTQVSGETATGSQQVAFDAMNQFLGIMTDPFTAGRGDSASAMSYAAPSNPTNAFAMFAKAPPKAFAERWNVWAAGFGGSRSTDGNVALGSSNTTSNIYGSAVGADYWFSPATVAGFSMAGGGTNFSVANGGSGRSDLVQVGAFVRHSQGSAYVAAAAAYGWQSITTDRLVLAGVTDRLQAAFNANAYSGRVEAGNRWLLPTLGGIGVTPYAAVQVTAFDLPTYAETSANGATTFGLTYAGKTVTDTRTELGLRTDKSFAVNDALLTLRGRAAWVHDFNTDRAIAATFHSLPGASFTVNGAQASRDAALTSASAEMKWSNGWAVAATFDGEFSDTTRSYAGKGVVRYAW